MYKKIIITLLSIITGLILINIINEQDVVMEENEKQITNSNMLTMMLETEAGTGNYEEVKQSEWPQEGFVFNASLSRCENGGTLSWDEEAKKVIMKSNTSDKCYVYFDIYVEPTLAELCNEKTFSNCIKENVYTADGANGLYYHDGVGTYTNASQEAGDNSYRYSGANPNNYVCFGSDAATCPDDNLYRIIGLFDDDQDGNYQIKLIKNKAIGAYTWDGSNNNDWTKASLNNSLNKELFWNNLGEWQNMVSPTTWHLGGMNGDYDTKEYYEGERNNAGYGSNPTTYTDEIGLMYPSDYGYAASPENWTTRLSDYNNDTNTANNWMYMGLQEWTITPYSSNRYRVFNVNSHGYVSNIPADYGFAARPVFYLESNVQLEGGTGNSSDPYRIQI